MYYQTKHPGFLKNDNSFLDKHIKTKTSVTVLGNK